jgi:hypothetical protein
MNVTGQRERSAHLPPHLVTMVADIVVTEGVADIAKRRQDGARLGATRPDS